MGSAPSSTPTMFALDATRPRANADLASVPEADLKAMDCCAAPDPDDRYCPECATTGKLVGVAPVRPHAPDAIDGPWRFCPNASCPVVFFLNDNVIDDGHVVSQVGRKAESKPAPVCFCFGHTAAAIAADLAQHGRSTIKDSVKNSVAGGFCACEHLNPAGTCCLPAIRREIKSQKSSGVVASTKPVPVVTPLP